MRKTLISLILLSLLAITSIFGVIWIGKKHNAEYQDSLQEVFTIEEGASSFDIIKDLYENHFISSRIHARVYYQKYDLSFYAGDYGISQDMTDKEVLNLLSQGTSNIDLAREFLIVEGEDLYTIAGELADFTVEDDTAEEILDYWSDPEVLQELIDNYDFLTDEILDPDILYPLEGYFYPAKYKLSDDYSLEQITYIILDTTENHLSGIDTGDYTIHQVLTMASIIERETKLDEDKPIAAGVFYNRIEEDMPFQSDITVLYAKQEHKEQVLYKDLKYDSPYNTYLYDGLPPGPISTVSAESVNATLNPDDNDYLYFFADQNTGQLYFSKTMDEHTETASEYAWNFNSESEQ